MASNAGLYYPLLSSIDNWGIYRKGVNNCMPFLFIWYLPVPMNLLLNIDKIGKTKQKNQKQNPEPSSSLNVPYNWPQKNNLAALFWTTWSFWTIFLVDIATHSNSSFSFDIPPLHWASCSFFLDWNTALCGSLVSLILVISSLYWWNAKPFNIFSVTNN